MLGSPVLAPLDVGRACSARCAPSRASVASACPGSSRAVRRRGLLCRGSAPTSLAPLPAGVRAVSIYSRSDGIVSWEACLDPSAEPVEVESSHTGMSVNSPVYRVLAGILDGEEQPWSG